MRIEFFFDFSCPYAYLGFTQIEALADQHGAELVWKPMLLGGVFRAVDTPQNLASSQPAAKTRHLAVDMQRWAARFETPLAMPAAHPMRSVRALRALLATESSRWPALIAALYRAYWVEKMDFSARETVGWALAQAGLSPQECELALQANEDEAIRAELVLRTQEAIDRGIFGAPAIFVHVDDLPEPLMFWGQDRLEMCSALLAGWRPGSHAAPQPATLAAHASEDRVIDFWFDYSSPFAYLCATQIEAVARRMNATLRYRPILLGALFKNLGTANVPLLAMSEAKRRYLGKELHYWASYWQVPFQFTTTFPLRTVSALRLALQAGDRIAELSTLLFQAAWVDNQDIGDHGVLRDILERGSFDADAMLAGCADQAVKDMLRDNTQEAEALGVFGVPTMSVSENGRTRLFWGQDRLSLMEWVLNNPSDATTPPCP